MTKVRKNTIPVLIDIKYKYSLNEFEEFYGDTMSYAEVEQESYIDLKRMVFEKINKHIKFRKFTRQNRTLTLKVDMLSEEYNKFTEIYSGLTEDKFVFLHDFCISAVKIMSDEDLKSAKKYNKEQNEH